MAKTADRIREEMEAEKIDQSELARRVSKLLRKQVRASTINKILTRGSERPRILPEIAIALNRNQHYLIYGKGPKVPDSKNQNIQRRLELLETEDADNIVTVVDAAIEGLLNKGAAD